MEEPERIDVTKWTPKARAARAKWLRQQHEAYIVERQSKYRHPLREYEQVNWSFDGRDTYDQY